MNTTTYNNTTLQNIPFFTNKERTLDLFAQRNTFPQKPGLALELIKITDNLIAIGKALPHLSIEHLIGPNGGCSGIRVTCGSTVEIFSKTSQAEDFIHQLVLDAWEDATK